MYIQYMYFKIKIDLFDLVCHLLLWLPRYLHVSVYIAGACSVWICQFVRSVNID